MEKDVIIKGNTRGGLWLIPMGRIVLDDHAWEVFSGDGDSEIMTSEELTKGISLKEFYSRLHKHMVLEGLK